MQSIPQSASDTLSGHQCQLFHILPYFVLNQKGVRTYQKHSLPLLQYLRHLQKMMYHRHKEKTNALNILIFFNVKESYFKNMNRQISRNRVSLSCTFFKFEILCSSSTINYARLLIS